jgi:hypothetical protein
MKLIILILITNSLFGYDVIEITKEPAFNYFASIFIWLLLIISPMLLVLALFSHFKRKFIK